MNSLTKNTEKMRAYAVIGANYGDEGKGLLTDYLVNRENAPGCGSDDTLVVRFNGGAQAGHTVVTPDGQRHIFSHFGAGTLSGARTFLSKYFVLNPMLFFREKRLLEGLGLKVQPILVDPRAMVTTPYDMIINQEHERFLGNKREGSCGIGFGETIVRNKRKLMIEKYTSHELQLSMMDLFESIGDAEHLYFKLQLFRREWVPARLAELNIPYTREIRSQVMNDALMWKYLEDLDALSKPIN